MDKVYSSSEAFEWFKKNIRPGEQLSVLCLDLKNDKTMIAHRYSEAQTFFEGPVQKPQMPTSFHVANYAFAFAAIIIGAVLLIGLFESIKHADDPTKSPFNAFNDCSQLGDCAPN